MTDNFDKFTILSALVYIFNDKLLFIFKSLLLHHSSFYANLFFGDNFLSLFFYLFNVITNQNSKMKLFI